MAYWLLKTEPNTYSFDQLVRDGKTGWNGVRNFQARNNLRKVAVGDSALIYHSGDDKAAVGIAQATRAAYPDVDPETPGDWVQIELKPLKKLARPVTLTEIKASKPLAGIALIRQSRLSVMPVTKAEFDAIVKMGSK